MRTLANIQTQAGIQTDTDRRAGTQTYHLLINKVRDESYSRETEKFVIASIAFHKVQGQSLHY